MALDNWVDKQDGIDDILAEDINSIANAVIETQEEINEAVDTVYDDFGTTIDMSYTWQHGNDGIHTLPLINIQVLTNGLAFLIFNNEVVIQVRGSLEDLQAIGFVLNKKYRIEIRNKEIVSLKLLDKIVDQNYLPTSANAQSGKAVAEALSGYVVAEVGKGLSSNDFTNEDKEKLYSALQNENVDQTYIPNSENPQSGKAVKEALYKVTKVLQVLEEAVSDKQDSLVSGVNIKTINNQSILGSGNITIEGGSDVEVDQTYNPTSENAQSGKAVAEAVTTEQNRADNTFANALKGTASGSAILIDDVSSVSHEMRVKISSDTVTDLTAVKVSRCGKNLFDINQAHNSIYSGNAYDTFSINDNVITATSDNSTTKTVIMELFVGELPAGDYILSLNAVIENTPKHNRPNEIFIWKNGSNLAYSSVTKTDGSYSKKIKFTLSEKAKINISFYKSVHVSQETVSDTVYKVTLSNIQLELGSTATDYEPYKECAEYTPNADGTVNGVTSLYPNTTLMTDTEGVLIDCEYNRDINKAFAALEAAIATNNS